VTARGQPGFGKSTLAATLAHSFAGLKRLGGHFFFNCEDQNQSTPSTVIKTLAFQLAALDSRIAQHISDTIRSNLFVLGSDLANQFSEFIEKPLSSIEGIDAHGPIVLILDALDECGNEETREGLLAALVQGSLKLLPCVRLLITSRPNEDIAHIFDSYSHIRRHNLEISRSPRITPEM